MYSLIPFNRREGNIFRYMDDIERSFFNNTISGKDQFRCDIAENENGYQLQAELPGFNREDINVEVDGDMLTISATHSEQNDETDDKGNYIRRERRFGSFSRSFNAEGIDVDGIKASYKNGVLSLELPKAREAVKEAKKIEITASEDEKPERKPLSAKVRKAIPKADKPENQPNA